MQRKLPTDDYEIAKRISAILLNEKKPMSLEKLRAELKDKSIDHEAIRSLSSKYKDHFQLFEEPLVKLVTKVDICKTHCTRRIKCSGNSRCCTGLHICKFHFLSGKCEWGEKCTYGHNLNLDHNKSILREKLLVDISVDDLKHLLSQAGNRTALTVPRICKFYNVQDDKCKHTRSRSVCPDLHICRHYVFDTCHYGNGCRRSHKLKDENNKCILHKHGLDMNKTEEEIVQELRNVLSAKKEDGSYADVDTSTTERTNKGTHCPSTTNQKKEFETEMTSCLETEMESTQYVSLRGRDVPIITGVMKKEESAGDETVFQTAGSPELHVDVTTEFVHFRYMSEITAAERKSKSRRNFPHTFDRNCLANVWVDNLVGNAIVVAYCVDINEKVHPYHLYGRDNCMDGVFVTNCKLDPEIRVNLQGISICRPKTEDCQSSVMKTAAYLNRIGITDVQSCENLVDKNSVFLKITVILEDKPALSKLTAPLQNKRISKQRDGNLLQGQKRTSDNPTSRDPKRRREFLRSSDEIRDKAVKPFQRFYRRVSTDDQLGSFIDTAGYQESALTWKAQGDALKSVCMICYPGGTGTGFRVGGQKNYIMTAAHVYDGILKSGCDGVGRRRHNPLKNDDVCAVFCFLKEGEDTKPNKFYFKDILHFRNDETDTVVLELKNNRQGTPMPPALEHFHTPYFAPEFIFVGHSEGKPLGINRVDKIVNVQSTEAKNDIDNIRSKSLEHTKCYEYPQGRVYEVQPHNTLENQHRFLFHCKFTKGASGSPGLVVLNDGRIVVVSMLLRGYPNWYYDPDRNMDHFRSSWSKDSWCVEQGVNLESVHNFMSKQNSKLAKEIFSS